MQQAMFTTAYLGGPAVSPWPLFGNIGPILPAGNPLLPSGNPLLASHVPYSAPVLAAMTSGSAGGQFNAPASHVLPAAGDLVTSSPSSHHPVGGAGYTVATSSPVLSPVTNFDQHLAVSAPSVVPVSGTQQVAPAGIQGETDPLAAIQPDTANKSKLTSETEKIHEETSSGNCESKALTDVETDASALATNTKRKLQFTVTAVKNDPLKGRQDLKESKEISDSSVTDGKMPTSAMEITNESNVNVDASETSTNLSTSSSSTSKVPVKKGRFRITDVKENVAESVVSSPSSTKPDRTLQTESELLKASSDPANTRVLSDASHEALQAVTLVQPILSACAPSSSVAEAKADVSSTDITLK